MKWMSSLLSVGSLLLGPIVWACPFCGGPPTQTWSELISEADVVVLAKLVSVDEGSRSRKPFSIVDVVRIHKGAEHVPTTQHLRVSEHLPGKPGDLFILNGTMRNQNVTTPDDTYVADGDTEEKKSSIKQVAAIESDVKTVLPKPKVLVWDLNQQVAESAFNYIVESPALDQETAIRLRYYAPFLESEDDVIAVDAWSEFANSKYEDVAAAKNVLDPAKLRIWVADENTNPQRLGLYGMMLGLCGNEADADFLRKQIGQPVDELRFGVEGLMGGFLILSGEPGLEFIETAWLQNAEASSFQVMAAMTAMRFIWAYEPDLFEKQRLRKSLYPALEREDLREIAITDLARWEDWSAISRLTGVYEQSKADDPRTTTAVITFALTLSNCESGEVEREYASQAELLLSKIRREYPRLVRSAERFAN